MSLELKQRLLLAARLGGAYLPKVPPSPIAAKRFAAIGLGNVSEFGPMYPFKNFFLNGERWRSGSSKAFTGPFDDTSNPIQVDAKGFPVQLGPATEEGFTQVARALFCNEAPTAGSYPQGQQWVLLWDGDPNASWGFAGNVVGSTDSFGHVPGTAAGVRRRTVQVGTTNGQLQVLLRAFDPAQPITRVVFTPAIYEDSYQTQPFNPVFLEHLAPFDLVRFMDWGLTNNSTVVSWSQRRGVDWCFQSWRPGVALEYQIALINTLGCDGWFCIPHQADDDYVTQMATLLRDTVAPERRVWIEYSNEVWNPMFQQYGWALQKAYDLGYASPGTPSGHYPGVLRWQAQRSHEIFAIFEAVFGGLNRLRRVVGAQNIGSFPITTLLDNQVGGVPLSARCDDIAIAPYFGVSLGSPAEWATVQNWTVDQVLDNLEAQVSSDNFWANPAAAKAAADARGVRLTTYEGGQHLGATTLPLQSDPAMNALFTAANRTERMGAIYQIYLDRCEQVGLPFLCHFVDVSRYASTFSWGLRENLATGLPKDVVFRAFVGAYKP